MALTFKLFLEERYKKPDHVYPLKLRITLDRKHNVLPLNILLYKGDWDDKNQRVNPSHPNAKLISIKISKLLTDIQQKALKFEATDTVYTAQDLANAIKSQKSSDVTFESFAREQIDSLNKAGRVGNAITYRTAMNKLLAYTKKKVLRFEHIDYRLLDDFTNSMLAEGMSYNGIASYMREIRAIYNKAINAGVVEQKYYPFSKYKIKTTKTVSRALTIDELKRIVALDLPEFSPKWTARNYFLLSFCLIGINFTDLYKLSLANYQSGRIIFNRSKTKKVYSIRVHPVAATLMKRCMVESPKHYLMPLLEKSDNASTIKKKAIQVIKNTNDQLVHIAKLANVDLRITTYYARYSWANIAKKLGYSKDLIAEALGHEYGNSVTGIYLDGYDTEIIDKANASVIEAVFMGTSQEQNQSKS